MLADWQKYCTVLILSKVRINFVGCNRLVFSGVLVSDVI